MKKKFIACLVMLLTFGIMLKGLSFAETNEEKKQIEEDLKTIGVLLGGDGVDSSSTVTRQEMVIVLVRMLGKEQVALSNYSNTYIPFTDVATWARPYVAYAYNNNLTKGTSATTFSGTDLVDVNQACTFMLRVLNYEDGTDYTWSSAYDAAVLLKIVDTSKDDLNKKKFIRSNLNTLVKDTLKSAKKNSNVFLINDLIQEGAISKDSALKAETFSNIIIDNIQEKQDEIQQKDENSKVENFIIYWTHVDSRYNGEDYHRFSAINMYGKTIEFYTKCQLPDKSEFYEIEYTKIPDLENLYMATKCTKKEMPWITPSDVYIEWFSGDYPRVSFTDGNEFDYYSNLIVFGECRTYGSLMREFYDNTDCSLYDCPYKVNRYVLGERNTILCLDYSMTKTKVEPDMDYDNFVFGSYYQSSSSSKDPIEWIVLEVDEDDRKVMIISKYGLDVKPYNETLKAVGWADCTLREWLNDEFIGKAFSSSEKKRIVPATLSDTKTTDKVFLLNSNEAESKYFKGDKPITCKATKYAIDKGARVDYDDLCRWWLRRAHDLDSGADYVFKSAISGENNLEYLCIRPVLWVSLD